MTKEHSGGVGREAPNLLDLFDALFTHASDCVLLSRTDGPILRANAAACAVLCRTEQEIREEGRSGLVVPSPELAQGLAERERTGVAAGEMVFRRPDGSTFLAEVMSTVIHAEGATRYAYVHFRDLTERRRVEKAQAEALETARARTAELQALLDAVPAAVYITRDPKSLYMETNLFGAELMRVHQGANVSKTGPAAEAPKTFRAMKDGKELVPETLPVQVAAARGVEVRDFEFDIVTEDGVTRHLLGNATPLRDMRGQATGAVGAFVDITERKRMENAVAVSEERLRNLIRSIPIPLAVNDRDRKIVSVNDKYTEVLGYTPSDVPDVPTWFEKAYPDPSYRRQVEEVWGAALREADATGGEVAARDYRVTAKDGSEHTMEISGVPVGDNFLVTLTDVTERNRAQAAVRESEEKYRTLVDSLHAGVVVHASDTSITLSNATASELLGLSPEQMRGRVAIDPAWRFVRGDDTPMPLPEYPVNQVISTQCPVTNLTLGIDRPVTKDRVWVLVNAYPIFTSPGHLQQVVVTFVDITGEKRAEAVREKLQTQLALASRLAAMGTLVAGVAHEINNPLSAQLSGQGIALELARDARMRRQLGTRLGRGEGDSPPRRRDRGPGGRAGGRPPGGPHCQGHGSVRESRPDTGAGADLGHRGRRDALDTRIRRDGRHRQRRES